MSLVAGSILGTAMFHLLPHSLERIPGDYAVEKAMPWMVLGIVVLVFSSIFSTSISTISAKQKAVFMIITRTKKQS